MAKVKGGDRFKKRLDAITGPAAVRKVGAALFAAGQQIQTDAQNSITDGAVTGANHQPSAPRTAPNNDSGTLANNIETNQVEPLKVQISSNAPYAAIQEFGGTINHPGGTAYFIGGNGLAVFVPDDNILSTYLPRTKPHTITLPERPYMRPAVEKNRAEVTKMVRNVVNDVLKGL
ncbi:HK97-gp10 family putative phage morphogenesis protein [Sphingomonas crocodyli]|uniref:HK97 gp10 family phage protein n=1 Tax=Sphingomonas crocodyli TaxID=1979270 RepID=A0A437M800_9SPHN|nr:HK97-gp10 family putative phage morphogenesis protein [Sphingomonas crocodyli]RVT93696.1 HK97 gp10 family phage protein [Sphingomonas crocodyli]